MLRIELNAVAMLRQVLRVRIPMGLRLICTPSIVELKLHANFSLSKATTLELNLRMPLFLIQAIKIRGRSDIEERDSIMTTFTG